MIHLFKEMKPMLEQNATAQKNQNIELINFLKDIEHTLNKQTKKLDETISKLDTKMDVVLDTLMNLNK